MRLFSGKITPLSEDLTKALVENHDIECESRKEVSRDLEAVFSNYLNLEREAIEKAKDIMASRGLPPTELPRLKKLAAEQKGIKIGEDLLDFLLDQLIEMLMHSANVEEIFAEDFELRRKLRDPLRKQAAIDVEIDAEVRSKIKHVKEGTAVWEVEYRRMMDDIKRRKGL